MSTTIFRLAVIGLEHRRIVFVAVFLPLVVTIVYAFTAPPVYTASSSFVSNPRLQSASLANMIRVVPQFQADLIMSRDILERVLLTRYANPHTGDSATFLEILGVEGDGPVALYDGRRELEGLISVRLDIYTTIVDVSVDSRYPEIAAALANQLVYELNKRNVGIQQELMREERDFFREREEESQERLMHAEDELRIFHEKNHPQPQSRLASQENILNRYRSPRLAAEENRLMRKIGINEKIYREVNQVYEWTSFMEASNIPYLLVIDRAHPPAFRSKPKRIFIITCGLVTGVMLSFLAVFSLRCIRICTECEN